jgi:hypothetical protein
LDVETPSSFSFLSLFTAYLLSGKHHSVTPLPTRIPTNERVRKTPPSTTSADTTVTIKRPKTEGAGSRGRTRISDFDDLTKSLTEETISIYQAQIVAVQPWPSTAENWESISQGWVEVCGSRSVRIELDDEIYKVVSYYFCFYHLSPLTTYTITGFRPCHPSSGPCKNYLKTLRGFCLFLRYTDIQACGPRQGRATAR